MALRRLDATDLARIAVFASLIAALGLPGAVSVFGSVPITAQTLAVMLAGAILGPWMGALSVTVFLALVALGMPVLAGGRGGIAVFVGPSAGFVLGFILGALVVGLIVHAGGGRPTWTRTLAGMLFGGIGAVYAIGMPVQSVVTRLPLIETMLQSLVFLPGDLIKAVLATALTMRLWRAYPRAFRIHRDHPNPTQAAQPATVDDPSPGPAGLRRRPEHPEP